MVASGRIRNLSFGIDFDINNNLLVNANRNVDRFKQNTMNSVGEMGRLEKGTASFGQTARHHFNNLKNTAFEVSNIFKDMRYQLSGIAATSVAFIGATTKSAMDFEQQMAMVGSVSQATNKELEQMSDTAIQAGRDTAHTAQSAAEAMELLARRGFEVSETIEALNAILDAASAEQLDLSSTTDIGTTAMRTMRMEAGEMDRVIDVLVQTSQTSAAEFSGLGETFVRAGSQIHSAGWNIEQAAATMGILANVGLKGSRAGTALSATLRDLGNAAEDGEVGIARTNVSIADSEGNFLSFAEIISQLDDSLEGLSETARQAELRSIFGDEALRAVLPILEQGAEGLSEYEQQLVDSTATAGRVAAEQLDTLAGTFEKLRGSINVASIIMGSRFSPVIRLGAEVITSLVNRFVELPKIVQTGIALFIGLTTAALTLAAAIGFTNVALTALMANPIVLKITGIIMVVSALIIILQDLWVALRGGNSMIVTLLQRFTDWIGLTWDVGAAFEWLGDRIVGIFGGVWDFIAGFTQWFLGLGGVLLGAIIAIFTFDTSFLENSLEQMNEAAMRGLGGLVDIFFNFGRLILEQFAGLGGRLIGFISEGIRNVINWVTNNPVTAIRIEMPTLAIADFVINRLNQGYKFIRGWLSENGIVDLPDFKISNLSDMFNFITGRLGDGFNRVREMVDNFSFGEAIQIAMNEFQNFMTSQIDYVAEKFNWLRDTISDIDISETISNAFSDSALGQATERVSDFASSVRDYLPFSPAKRGALADIDKVGKGFYETIAESLRSEEDTLISRLEQVSSNVIDALGLEMFSIPNIFGGSEKPKTKVQEKTENFNNETSNNQDISNHQSRIIEVAINEINVYGEVNNEQDIKSKMKKAAREAMKEVIAQETASVVGDFNGI